MLTPSDSAPESVAGPVPGGSGTVLREASDELERRIAGGEAARAEEYLSRNPALAADPELALDLIFVEYSTRRALGQTPPREEFYLRFPQWRTQLDRQFQIDELLEETLQPDAAPPGDSTRPKAAERGGQSNGRYRVLRLLARGGIGQVMRAVDTELNREVAVKELQPAVAESAEARERFVREAEITARLEHPGIVPVYGLGRDPSGRPFYAMRLVQGQSLLGAVREFHQRSRAGERFRGVEFQKLLRRFLHVCETVEFAHSRGILHRDLKPANILLGPFGETLVVDWGLARANTAAGPPQEVETKGSAGPSESPAMVAADWSNQLTPGTGQWIGTPAFMSPEQAAGNSQEIGPAADVYGLGATLYFLLTGRAPFINTEIQQTLELVAAGRFPRPREIQRAIPRAVEAVCRKAMARRPEERYRSAREMAEDLERWLADEPVTAGHEPWLDKLARWGRRHRSRVVAGIFALLIVSAVSLAAAVRINYERLRADRERIEANRRNARLALDRGMALASEHEQGAALLWFAKSLEHAPSSDAPLRRVILTNMHATQHHLLRRQRVFSPADGLSPIAFSPDGRHLVTTGDSQLGMIWDAESGVLLAKHPLPSGRIVAVGFSAAGQAIVATFQRESLLVQRLPVAAAEGTRPLLTITHSGDLANAVFDWDGQHIATATPAGQSAKTRIWRIADGELVAELEQPSRVEQLVFQPRTGALAVVHLNSGVRLWQVAERRLLREFRAEGGRIFSVAFTPDGKRLLAGHSTGSVSCWNSEDGKRLFDLARHSGNVTAVACASDGQTIAAAWDTGTTRTWDLETARPASELLRLDRFTSNLAFRPGTRQLMVAAGLNEFVLWQLPDIAREALPLNQPSISSLAFSRDGKVAVTGSFNRTARLREGATGKAFGRVLQHAGPVTQVAFRPSDDAVVLTASRDGTVRLWNASSGEPHGQLMQHRSDPRIGIEVAAAAFSPDGRIVATGDSAGIIRTWNGETGELLREVDHRLGYTTCLCFSPSGEQLVAGFGISESAVVAWSVAGGPARWKGQHGEPIRSVAFSPDGKLVLSASNDDTARFWDAESGQPIGRELRHRGEVWVAGFSPDGKIAVTGSYDAMAKLWSVPGGEPLGEPLRHEGIVMAAAFSADGQRLLTGSGDRSARLWDVATCLPLSLPVLHGDFVRAVGISPAGDLAITGRAWHLPAALPDDPLLVDLWVKLATARTFATGENIEWLAAAALDAAAVEFQDRVGKPWDQWVGEAP